MAAVDHDLTSDEWAALVEAWGRCAYCAGTDVPLQRDCVRPISRGGRYTLDNMAPACASCNASKSNDEVTSWLRRKRLDERSFLLRHLEIQQALARRFEPEAQQPGPPVDRQPGDGQPSSVDLRQRPDQLLVDELSDAQVAELAPET